MALRKTYDRSGPLYDQWCGDIHRVTLEGKRIWRCWHCDNLSPWTETHGCYTSIAIQEEGDIPYPVWCSDECKDALVAKQIIPLAMEALPW